MGGGKPLFFVWVAVVIFHYSNFCYADGNVGCLFSQTVCLVNEWCYDDFAFGKCLPIYEGDVIEDDKFRYSMTKFDLEKFEEELQHLVDLGYHWEHAYTQCILQAMLKAARFSGSVDTSICASFADFNTMAINPDNPDSEMDGHRELAFVKFTPNSNLAKTDFANEVYWPSQYVEDLKPSNDEHMSASLFNEDIIPEARDQLRNSLQVPSESNNNKHEIFSSREDAFEHLKNLNNFVGNNANDYNLPEVIKLLNKYRPNLQSENYAESPARKVKKSAFSENHNGIAVVEFPASDYEDNNVDDEQLASLSDSLDNSHSQYSPSTAEFITENRMDPEQINLFTNFINSIKSSFKDTVDFKNLQNNVLPESRIYVDEDEPELYRLDSGSGEVGPKGLFDVNGDIAIEGPIINDYRDGDLYSSGSIKKLLRHWSEESKKLKENKKNDFTVLYAEGGVVYPVDEVGKTPSQIQDLMENYDWGFNRQERLDVKKPGPPFDVKTSSKEENKTSGSELSAPPAKKGTEHENHNHNDFEVDTSYAYVGFKDSFRSWKEGAKVVHEIGELLHLEPSAFTYPRIDRNEVTFRVDTNSKGLNAIDVAKSIDNIKDDLQSRLGVVVTTAGVGDKSKDPAVLIAPNDSWKWDEWVEWGWGGWGVMAATVILTVTSCVMLALIVRRNAKRRSKLQGLASDTDTEATQHYQDLCRARMSGKQQQVGTGILGTIIDPGAVSTQRVTTLSRDSDGNSPSNRSSTSSWSEEPALTNMDISTGHMVLAYMEDHLKNKDRLEQEWEALCAYDAEPCTTLTASANDNVKKNRYPDVLPYDHARVTLNQLTNNLGSDYINASTITDHDPRNPAYIASQGPLPHTTADFWQMVWEQGSVVMVMLTRLTENGTVMCHRYWSEDGSALYHIYEVHLVSEHIWCDDYLVRSFYLKNIKTGETRTVTQFHFLSWPENGVPSSTKALLEFRRKVNKSYRGRSCPIVVHCSDGASRTGTYCLIDMVLNRMAKGAKEIDIAATLEHIRDQRPNMVTTKHQFEFVLMAVAEEVHAILKALPSQLQQQKEASKEKESG